MGTHAGNAAASAASRRNPASRLTPQQQVRQSAAEATKRQQHASGQQQEHSGVVGVHSAADETTKAVLLVDPPQPELSKVNVDVHSGNDAHDCDGESPTPASLDALEDLHENELTLEKCETEQHPRVDSAADEGADVTTLREAEAIAAM